MRNIHLMFDKIRQVPLLSTTVLAYAWQSRESTEHALLDLVLTSPPHECLLAERMRLPNQPAIRSDTRCLRWAGHCYNPSKGL
jgi:hypothetical protein